jgi:putative ABC transport system permease protein
MLKNYFKIAWRSLGKKKLFTFINVTGLTLGLTFVALIGLYVYNNVSVDKAQPDNLFRVTTAYTAETRNDEINSVGRALVPSIAQNIPEVDKVIPLKNFNGVTIKKGTDYFFDKLALAGKDFLQAFNFPLLNGNPATALNDPFSIVLTEELAKKYFGKTDVLGQTLVIDDSVPFKVTGVLQKLAPSHMHFDALLSFSSWEKWGGNFDQWFTWDMTCYVTLKPGVDKARAAEKIAALSMQYNKDEYSKFGYNVKHRLEPVKGIFLHSSMPGFNKPGGSMSQLYILSVIGLAMLLLACINFINLTTAYQAERTVEVGIRKTMGAKSFSLIAQFMTETFALILIAFLLAIGLVVLLLPVVENISGQSISLHMLYSPVVIAGGLGLMLLTTLLAGWYPSLLLSRLSPMGSIKKAMKTERGNFTLRKGLVVFQFAVSLILITGTIIAARQFNYIKNKDLGFNRDAVVIVDLRKAPYKELRQNYENIKQELRKVPGVSSIAGSTGLPGKYGWDGQLVQAEGFAKEKSFTLEVIPSDMDYVRTLGIKMVAGRDFSPSFTTDATNGVLLNEEACKLIGWNTTEAVGKMISTSGMDSGRVIGVMQNYHQHGLQEKVSPVMIFSAAYAYSYMAVQVNGDAKNAIGGLATIWKKRFPGYSFNYTMLEDDLNKQYAEENRLAKVINIFSVLTIFIAALGLFGLVTFITAQRTKEIGVRKVLGASVSSIVALIAKQFLLLVGIAIIISVPVAWMAGEAWLQDFAYRISIEWWMFLIAGVAAIIIALFTVSYQAIRAALVNPVKSLRTE